MMVAFVLAAYAHDANMFCLMRFLCGLAVGGTFTVLPMYIGEIAEDAVRGSLGSFMQLFITFGLLFSYAVGPYMTVMAFNLACMLVPVMFMVSSNLPKDRGFPKTDNLLSIILIGNNNQA